MPSSWNERTNCALLFAVLDGHSGSECVDFIQENLHLEIQKQVLLMKKPMRHNAFEHALTVAFSATDHAFLQTAKDQSFFSGSTALLLLMFEDGTMISANLGDCRAGNMLSTSSFAISQISGLLRHLLHLSMRSGFYCKTNC
jgi:serine/threonine protein phosphatase PrpC